MIRDLLIGLATAVLAACALEPWARLLHGRFWHGPLWGVHASHHEPRQGRFERNDALSGLHAPLAMVLVVVGCQLPGATGAILVGAGVGMTAFGFAYLVVHDGLVHERLPVAFLLRFAYFRRIRAAHRVHHARGAEPYGLFRGPEELLALKRRERASRHGTPNAPTRPDRAPRGPVRTRSVASPPSSAGTS